MDVKQLLKALRMIQQFRNDEITYTEVRKEFTTENLNYAADVLNKLEADLENAKNALT